MIDFERQIEVCFGQKPTPRELAFYRQKLLEANRALAETWPSGKPVTPKDQRDYRRRDRLVEVLDELLARHGEGTYVKPLRKK